MKPRTIDRRIGRLLAELAPAELSRLRDLLTRARYEVYPADNAYERVVRRLPPGSVPIAVTMSFQKPIAATLELVDRLTTIGFEVATHVSARQLDSVEEAEAVIERLRRRGVERVVVIGGDASSEGPFPAALDLLRYLRDRGNPFRDVGIAGHPEGHPQVRPEVMMQALLDKSPYATSIVTQLCFDPELIGTWAAQVRLNHLDLPIHVSIPGVLDSERLIETLDLIGVGESRKSVKAGRGRFRPTELVIGLARLPIVQHGIVGLHVSTFNEIDETENWRQGLYDAAGRGATARG